MSGIETPATRTLAQVLRQQLVPPGDPVHLLLGKVTALYSGGDANAYVEVEVGGERVKVPKLRSASPTVGDAAYMLASRDFMLVIGSCRFT